MRVYHPEMGEQANAGDVFRTEHNFRDSWCLEWLAERDAEAQAIIKALRIRPRRVQSHEPGTYSGLFGNQVRTCSGLISGRAVELVRPYASHSMLLD